MNICHSVQNSLIQTINVCSAVVFHQGEIGFSFFLRTQQLKPASAFVCGLHGRFVFLHLFSVRHLHHLASFQGQRPNEVQQRDTWFPQMVHEEQHHIFELKSAIQVATGLFDLAVSVWFFRSGRFGHGTFRSVMKSCRNLTLMQSRPVWCKAYSLHHFTVGYQMSRHSTQSVLRLRFAIAARAVGKVFYSG